MVMFLDFLDKNIGWIKDLFAILFSGTITILAILTYRRAKETFLQPVRAEVIKKQTELLSDLLEFFYKNNPDLDLDYSGLIDANLFQWLKEYGFLLKDQEQIEKSILENLDKSMLLFPNAEGKIEEFEIVSSFDEEKKIDKKSSEDFKKNLYEKAKNGDVDINKVFMTKKCRDYLDKLNFFIENPFMPITIKKHLENLILDIHKNIKFNLRKVITDFIKQLFDRGPNKFSPAGVFNDFNHIRIHHKKNYKLIKNEIRTYLKIDNMP